MVAMVHILIASSSLFVCFFVCLFVCLFVCFRRFVLGVVAVSLVSCVCTFS